MRTAALCLMLAHSLACSSENAGFAPADNALHHYLAGYRLLDAQHQLNLADEAEPGQRLIVLGRLINSDDGAVVSNHEIRVYQADHSGAYLESVVGDESTARLNGFVRTDSLGRFLISTVLPGDYGATDNNRHIHLTVPGATPDAYDFYFLQYINPGLLRWARRSDQAVVLDLKTMGEFFLVATADLAVKNLEL